MARLMGTIDKINWFYQKRFIYEASYASAEKISFLGRSKTWGLRKR